MTRGVPARLKGKDDGMEIDTIVKVPPPSLLDDNDIRTPQQQLLYKHRTTVTDDGYIKNAPTEKRTPTKTKNTNIKSK